MLRNGFVSVESWLRVFRREGMVSCGGLEKIIWLGSRGERKESTVDMVNGAKLSGHTNSCVIYCFLDITGLVFLIY